MALNYFLNNSHDLLSKLERERSRVFDAVKEENEVDMCDFFFNYCITAHSIRDWVIKDPNFKFAKSEIHCVCNKYPELEACRDIANSHKHFNFEYKKTKSTFVSSSPVIDVFHSNQGKLSVSQPRGNIDIAIFLSNGAIVGLWEFMESVQKAWHYIFNLCSGEV